MQKYILLTFFVANDYFFCSNLCYSQSDSVNVQYILASFNNFPKISSKYESFGTLFKNQECLYSIEFIYKKNRIYKPAVYFSFFNLNESTLDDRQYYSIFPSFALQQQKIMGNKNQFVFVYDVGLAIGLTSKRGFYNNAYTYYYGGGFNASFGVMYSIKKIIISLSTGVLLTYGEANSRDSYGIISHSNEYFFNYQFPAIKIGYKIQKNKK